MIVFVGCGKKKKHAPCKAKEMYIGNLFKAAYKYAEQQGGKIYILSAKYGLLDPEEVIEPYNVTLAGSTKTEQKKWAAKVYKQCVAQHIDFNEPVMFLCGESYRKYLMQVFREWSVPLLHLGLGEQISWLKKHTN